MNTKVFAIIAFAAITVTLITAAATTTNAFASHRHHHHGSSSNSQSLAQSNSCGSNSKCSNIGSQIQGDGNSVAISSSQ
jgi:hypothetical protein